MLLIEGYVSGLPIMSFGRWSPLYPWVDLEELGIGHCPADLESARALVEVERFWGPPAEVEEKHAGLLRDATRRAVALVERSLAP